MDSLRQWLDKVRADLADLCRPHVDPTAKLSPGVRFLMVDLGEGWSYAAVSDTAPFEVSDANEAFSSIRVIEHHLNEQGDLYGDFEFIAPHLVRLGRAIEHIEGVCPIQEDAERGRKVIGAASAGGKCNATFSKKEKLEVAALVDVLVGKGLSRTDACRRVAGDYGVSYKTIERAFKATTVTS